MLEQANNAVTFFAFFTESKIGKTGLTVGINVWKITASTVTQIVTSGSAVEVGSGLYFYRLSVGLVDVEAEYVGVFATATTTVDVQQIPALWVIGRAGIESLDALVSSRLAPGGEVTLAASAIQAIWNAAVAALTLAGSIGKRLVDNLTGDAFTRLGAPAAATIAEDIATVRADLEDVAMELDDVDSRIPSALVAGRMDSHVGAMAADTLTAAALASDAVAEIASGASAPTVADIVEGVWDEPLSAHLEPGSTGEAQGYIDDIKTRTDLITSDRFTIAPPVSRDGTLTIFKGDSYSFAEGRAIPFERNGASWPSDLAGYVVTITIDNGIGESLLTDALVIVTPTGEEQLVRWEPTSAETSVLPEGTWAYEVKATKGSEVARLEYGLARVRVGTT